MKKYVYFVLAMLLLTAIVIVVSNHGKDDPHMIIRDSKFNSVEEVKDVISYSALASMLDYKPSLRTLHEKFNLESIKLEDERYIVTIQTDKNWMRIYFDSEMNYITMNEIQFSDDVELVQLQNVTLGTTLSDVMNIDPTADYSFIYASWTEYPQVSSHYLEDGNVFVFTYDNSYKVCEIHSFIL